VQKRHQIFISSTYTDLREERQAAVEAVLKAGHIPAGMELFTASSKAQLEIIKRWIDESDIFVLILGHRYGSIDPDTDKSYIHVEYEYALAAAKSVFAIVQSEEGRDSKIKTQGADIVETSRSSDFVEFRKQVLATQCEFFTDSRDITIAILSTIPKLAAEHDLPGWVSTREIETPTEISSQLARLAAENGRLRSDLDKAKRDLDNRSTGEPEFEDIECALRAKLVSIPPELRGPDSKEEQPLFDIAVTCTNQLAGGVSNALGDSDFNNFIYFHVAAPLITYGLTEHVTVPSGVSYQRLRLTETGKRFFRRYPIAAAKQSMTKQATRTAPKKSASKKSTKKKA